MRTITEIAESIDISKLSKYQLDLVYVDYRDRFDPDQIEALLRGDWPPYTDEWISDRQWESACDLADELFKDECDDDDEFDELDWRPSDERQSLIYEIMEADTSNPYEDLMRNTGQMLFRVSPDEDSMVWVGDIINTPEVLHAELKLAPELLPTVQAIWPEIEGYTVSGGSFGATIMFSANPADLWLVPSDATIAVTDPYLWICNPWQGNGWGEVATGVTVTIRMEDVHTDKAAWGYSADDVFGGLSLDDSTITQVQGADA